MRKKKGNLGLGAVAAVIHGPDAEHHLLRHDLQDVVFVDGGPDLVSVEAVSVAEGRGLIEDGLLGASVLEHNLDQLAAAHGDLCDLEAAHWHGVEQGGEAAEVVEAACTSAAAAVGGGGTAVAIAIAVVGLLSVHGVLHSKYGGHSGGAARSATEEEGSL